MRFAVILGVIVVVIILITASGYVIFFTGEENNGGVDDNEVPTIDTVTGDTTTKAGKTITISATFSDNVNVTVATLYYKKASADSWGNTSILSGSADISVPSSPVEDWYYYVTIDDAAGNGPVGDPSIDGSVYYTITVSDNNGNGGSDLTHTVFIEEGTATDCKFCPNVATILDELLSSGDYRFYYVSLVEDMNDKASDRLKEDYNNVGQPTVFIDGGYKVIKGGLNEKSEYAQAIQDAESRDAPNIQITVEAEYDNNTNELNVVVHIENKESDTYSGQLRVYINEIISPRWSDFNGNPYKHAFLEYAINKNVEIATDENKTFSEKWNIAESGFSNVYPENLKLVAVIFNSESKQGYSTPPDEGPFNAYYADDADETRVAEGTLPPSIGISSPKKAQRYIFGREKSRILSNNTLIIGRITIKANVEAESSVEKVEFIVSGGLRGKTINETLYEEPYDEWTWKNLAWGTWTITVKVYDSEGRTASDSIDVKAYMYGFPIFNRILNR